MRFCKHCGELYLDDTATECGTCHTPTEEWEGFTQDMRLFEDTDLDKSNDVYRTLLRAYNNAAGKVAKAEGKLGILQAARDEAGNTLTKFWQLANGYNQEGK